jgi:hypothetical protein
MAIDLHTPATVAVRLIIVAYSRMGGELMLYGWTKTVLIRTKYLGGKVTWKSYSN